MVVTTLVMVVNTGLTTVYTPTHTYSPLMQRVRLHHKPEQISHRLKDLLQLEVHLWDVAILSYVSLEAEDQVFVRQHCREVLRDVDVQDCVEVLVLVVL